MTDYSLILSRRWPNAQWTLNNNDLSTLVWLSEGIPPTREQLDSFADEVESEVVTELAQAMRQTAYIAESDPLFFEWQRGEGTEQAWLDKVEEIKQRYPLPE